MAEGAHHTNPKMLHNTWPTAYDAADSGSGLPSMAWALYMLARSAVADLETKIHPQQPACIPASTTTHAFT
jgi:hypothetical protein